MFRSSQKVNDNDFMSQHIFAEGRGKQQRRIGERRERERKRERERVCLLVFSLFIM